MEDPRFDSVRAYFPDGHRFYGVKPRSGLAQDYIFFNSITHLLLAAIISDERILPEYDDPLSPIAAKTFKGSLAGRFRFPNIDEVIISEYSIKEPLAHYNASNLTDDFFAQISRVDPRTVLQYHRPYKTNFIGDRFFIFGSENPLADRGQADYDAYTKEVRVIYDAKENTVPVTLEVVRIKKLDNRFVHVFDHYINWETVWAHFFNVIAMGQKVDLVAVLDYFKKVIGHPDSFKGVFNGGFSPGYVDCIDSLKGFVNHASSCFMDSVLMCMFAFKNSPFFRHMVLTPLVQENLTSLACNVDPDADFAIRRATQLELRSDLKQIMRGERIICGQLRKLVGAFCKGVDGEDRDLSGGEQDPLELYARLCAMMNYNPTDTSLVEYRALTEGGEEEFVINVPEIERKSYLPSVSLESGAISWPWSWGGEYEYLPVRSYPEFPWKKNVTNVTRSDCIVVHLSRNFRDPRTGQYDERKVNFSPMLIEHEFDVNGIVYTLRAATYLPYQGHYACLLKCGRDWYNYDDTDTKSVLASKMYDDGKARGIISERAVLLFYYPPLPEMNDRDRDRLREFMASND